MVIKVVEQEVNEKAAVQKKFSCYDHSSLTLSLRGVGGLSTSATKEEGGLAQERSCNSMKKRPEFTAMGCESRES